MVFNMQVKTRDFGEIEISRDRILHFVQPPFGFDEYTDYTFIFDEEIGTHIVWMQSVDRADVCFILFDPTDSAPFYAPRLPEAIGEMLGGGELVYWTIGVISENPMEISLNLKSPVIVNLHTNLGAQVILEQDYPVRFPAAGKEAGSSC